MSIAAVLILLVARDTAQGGAAYREGLEALEKGRHDAAALKFQEALRHEAAETESLQYRDNEGRRHSHAYHPHFQWARARVAQSDAEKSSDRRRELLLEAVTHLGLTRHPDAAALLRTAKGQLADLAKAAPPAVPAEDPFAAANAGVRKKVEELCDAQRFEDARRALEARADLYAAREKEKRELSDLIRNRARIAIDAYERLMAAGLENLAAIDPIEGADSVLPALKRGLVPPSVQVEPDAPFRWLKSFIALYEGEVGNLKATVSMNPDQVERTAAAFERASREALDAGSFLAFRAARHVARSARLARLQSLAERNPEAAEKLLASSEESARKCAEDLNKRLGEAAAAPLREDLNEYLKKDLKSDLSRLGEIKARLESLARENARAVETIRAAEDSLRRPDVVARARALAAVKDSLEALESGPGWARLPGQLRARALFARALAEASAGFLEGEPASKVADRCRPAAAKAFALDPKADVPWRERLSPRLLSLFDDLRGR